MEHRDVRRTLSAYLDDAVSQAEKTAIENHLADCENCRNALAELRKTIGHLKTLPEVEPPPWLTSKIMATVRELPEPLPLSLWSRIFRPLYVKLPLEALAVLLICITGYRLAVMNETLPSVSDSTPQIRVAPQPAPNAAPVPQASQASPEASPVPGKSQPLPKTPQVSNQLSSRPEATKPAAPVRAQEENISPPERPAGNMAFAPPPPARAQSASPPAADHDPRQSSFELRPNVDRQQLAEREEAEREERMLQVREESRHREAVAKSAHMAKKRSAASQLYEESGRQQGMNAPSAAPSASRYGGASEYGISALDQRTEQSVYESPAQPVEIKLSVTDADAAVRKIEKAVVDAGGRIVNRTYGTTGHRLSVRLDARKLPALVGRLERIAPLAKRPQPGAEEEGTVDLSIRW